MISGFSARASNWAAATTPSAFASGGSAMLSRLRGLPISPLAESFVDSANTSRGSVRYTGPRGSDMAMLTARSTTNSV